MAGEGLSEPGRGLGGRLPLARRQDLLLLRPPKTDLSAVQLQQSAVQSLQTFAGSLLPAVRGVYGNAAGAEVPPAEVAGHRHLSEIPFCVRGLGPFYGLHSYSQSETIQLLLGFIQLQVRSWLRTGTVTMVQGERVVWDWYVTAGERRLQGPAGAATWGSHTLNRLGKQATYLIKASHQRVFLELELESNFLVWNLRPFLLGT